jgi:hypothetical protein
MAEMNRWRENEETMAFLVALDISGFSRYMTEPDQLLDHRMRFFKAVERTTLIPIARQLGTVVVHFLGDELRLAFQNSVGGREVYKFIDDVQAVLENENREVVTERRTRVKGTVFKGVVTWKTWQKCTFLDGSLPFKAQRWMAELQAGEIAMDAAFKLDLALTAVLPYEPMPRAFGDETGYLLWGGV